LQLRVGVEALLAELPAALDDDGHRGDIESLEACLPALEVAAGRALTGDLPPESASAVSENLGIAERVLRRRRLLNN
jgi:hypothetical protein